jgi:hypothetical protein
MDALNSTSEYLLTDARAALRRRLSEECRTDLSRAFAAWLWRETASAELAALVSDAAERRGALQDFQTVAILGFGAHAGMLCGQQIEVLKSGLFRQAGREVVIDELPVGYCSDAVGFLGVSLGTKAVSDAELKELVLKWTSKFLRNSYDAERTEDWHRCLYAAGDRQLGSPLNLPVPKSPATADVRTMLVAKGVLDRGIADDDGPQTLKMAMRELPDELPCDRAALRLAAVESVIEASAPSTGTTNEPHAKRSGSLSIRDQQIHDLIGSERFRNLKNAEIMKDPALKKSLRNDFDLEQGSDAAKSCLDRIRHAREYPLSREITKIRSAQKTGNGQKRSM